MPFITEADEIPTDSDFISFWAGIDDDRMKQLYDIHNNWLKQQQ